MPLISEARVETDRPGRYLVQLCKHVDEIARVSPAMSAEVRWSDHDGLIDFGWGRCSLQAESGALVLRAEADDQDALDRLTQAVGGRLTGFARRDRLSVTWSAPVQAPDSRQQQRSDEERTEP